MTKNLSQLLLEAERTFERWGMSATAIIIVGLKNVVGRTLKQNSTLRLLRGYWGVAFYEPKFEENIGTAIRSAHCFGADFIALIGKRFAKTPADTMATERHIPIYEYKDLKDFTKHLPVGCELVVVECDGEDIRDFKHPQRAVYLLGGEDRSVPKIAAKRVKFPTSHCVNMAMAATLISYDRIR